MNKTLNRKSSISVQRAAFRFALSRPPKPALRLRSGQAREFDSAPAFEPLQPVWILIILDSMIKRTWVRSLGDRILAW
ncbi:MAG: hypothetical protein ABSG97_05185 [Sedimentisphaerales bacterium]